MYSVGTDWKGVGMFGWNAAGMDQTDDRCIASAAEADWFVVHNSMSVQHGPESLVPHTETREVSVVVEGMRRKLPQILRAMLRNGGRD